MADTPKYAEEVHIGDRILHDGTEVTVTAVRDVPLTEEDYYAPATPGRLDFEVEYPDGSYDEFTVWETDLLTVVS